MNWDILKKLFTFVDDLPGSIKNFIIIAFFLMSVPVAVHEISNMAIEDYLELSINNKKAAEEYALKVAPLINHEVINIYKSDRNINNVILMSYHNNTESLNMFSYLYLKGLTAEPGYDTWKEDWGSLEFVHYSTEIRKIHKKGFLLVNDIEKMSREYPKLSKKLENCEVKNAAFYPIEGSAKPVGMIIIYYNSTPSSSSYQASIVSSLQKLSSLLDYENLKKQL